MTYEMNQIPQTKADEVTNTLAPSGTGRWDVADPQRTQLASSTIPTPEVSLQAMAIEIEKAHAEVANVRCEFADLQSANLGSLETQKLEELQARLASVKAELSSLERAQLEVSRVTAEYVQNTGVSMEHADVERIQLALSRSIAEEIKKAAEDVKNAGAEIDEGLAKVTQSTPRELAATETRTNDSDANTDVALPEGVQAKIQSTPRELAASQEDTEQAMAAASASDEARLLADVRLVDGIEEAFYRQTASNDHLIQLARREDRMLLAPEASRLPQHTSPLCVKLRYLCLHFMSDHCSILGMDPSSWFEVAAIFDAYCIRKAPLDLLEFEHFPSLCVALVNMMKKTDCCKACVKPCAYTACVSRFAEALQRIGVPASEGSADMIIQQELELLTVLGWRINVPSLETWLTLYCTRFNLLTYGMFVRTLDWVWNHSLSIARWLLLRHAASVDMPPKRLARGLFCVMLAIAGLVPVKLLKPENVCATSWEELLDEIHPMGSVPACPCQPTQVTHVLQALRIATGLQAAALKEDCSFAASLTRDVLHELQHPFGMLPPFACPGYHCWFCGGAKSKSQQETQAVEGEAVAVNTPVVVDPTPPKVYYGQC